MGIKEQLNHSSPYDGLDRKPIQKIFLKIFGPSDDQIRQAQSILDHPTQVTDGDRAIWRNKKMHDLQYVPNSTPFQISNPGALSQYTGALEYISNLPNETINNGITQDAVATLSEAGLLSPIRTPKNNMTTIPLNKEVSISHTG